MDERSKSNVTLQPPGRLPAEPGSATGCRAGEERAGREALSRPTELPAARRARAEEERAGRVGASESPVTRISDGNVGSDLASGLSQEG